MTKIRTAGQSLLGTRISATLRPVPMPPSPFAPFSGVPTVDEFRSWIVMHEGGIVAVSKPAGILSQGSHDSDGADLVSLARAAFGKREVGVLHRLDRNVSGVVLLALDPKSARFVSEELAKGRVTRSYVAVVRGAPKPGPFVIDAALLKDSRSNEVRVVDASIPGAKASSTRVEERSRWRSTLGQLAELSVNPISGRSHQIRVHLAHAGLPIVGDPKYGVPADGIFRPLLHSESIEVHARGGFSAIHVVVPPPWGPGDLLSIRRRASLTAPGRSAEKAPRDPRSRLPSRLRR